MNKHCTENLYKNFKINYLKILKVFFPVVPHLSSECISQLNKDEKIEWPQINEEYLKIKNIKIVIQINGKKRSLIETEKPLEEEALLNLVKNNGDVSKYLTNKDIFKVIYVKNKLLNLLVK